MTSCTHNNEIIDSHEGTIICTDCGVVKDPYYLCDYKNNDSNIAINSSGQVENILEQLNVPQQFNEIININLNSTNYKSNSHPQKKTHQINKVISEIYNTLNQDTSNILLKDIMNLSRLSTKQIKCKDVSIVNIEQILEKYTKRFNINYKNCTVIKEEYLKYINTGFQPLTIIGGIIYKHLKEINSRRSMKYIAELLGISSISIQRFIKKQFKPKNEISSRN
jgi:transcription initiation factor TFIIIB Brf1 subunit/transcription initiation factor TFIIB